LAQGDIAFCIRTNPYTDFPNFGTSLAEHYISQTMFHITKYSLKNLVTDIEP